MPVRLYVKLNVFFNCKYKCEIYLNIFESFKYICVVRYLKLRFYCLTCSFTDFRDFNS